MGDARQGPVFAVGGRGGSGRGVLAAPSAHAGSWGRCADFSGLRCTTVSVPLDRSGTVAGRIGLRVRAHGRRAGRAAAAVPGGRPRRRGGVRADRRGVRGARARAGVRPLRLRPARHRPLGLLRCPALERDPRLRSTRAGEDCARRLGGRGRFYTTAESVEDVEAVRAALGVQKLTLLAISYGTKLALAYARVHPDHVERLVLDSVVDPDDATRSHATATRRSARRCARCARPVRASRPGGGPGRAQRATAAAPCAAPSTTRMGAARERTLTPLALSDLLFDADYDPAAARRRAGRGARRARPRRRGAAAAPDRGVGADSPGCPARRVLVRPLRRLVRGDAAALGSAASLAQRAAQARRGSRALGPGALAPFDFGVVRADLIDLCLRWPEAGRAAPSGGGAVSGRADADPAGRRGPADAAGRVGARGRGHPGRHAGRRAGRGSCGPSGDPSGCGLRSVVAFVGNRRRGAHLPARGDRRARQRRPARLAR